MLIDSNTSQWTKVKVNVYVKAVDSNTSNLLCSGSIPSPSSSG